jgi:hypothetical protein
MEGSGETEEKKSHTVGYEPQLGRRVVDDFKEK